MCSQNIFKASDILRQDTPISSNDSQISRPCGDRSVSIRNLLSRLCDFFVPALYLLDVSTSCCSAHISFSCGGMAGSSRCFCIGVMLAHSLCDTGPSSVF